MMRRGRRARVGLPEFVLAVLVCLSVVSLTVWAVRSGTSAWVLTEGQLTSCQIVYPHYNAVDSPPRVSVGYTYSGPDRRYEGRWEGYWPEAESPNALPASRLGELNAANYPVLVYINLGNPAEHALHTVPKLALGVYGSVSAALSLVTFLYVVRVYPRWRRQIWGRRGASAIQ